MISIWPSLIYLGLTLMGIGIQLANYSNGKITDMALWNTFFGTVISLWLLWWGGFFSPLIGS